MTYITKPKVHHPKLERNELGLTRRDYEGTISTLCAGCGHDSITAAIVQSFYELSIPPHRVAKLSGIGCSAKTPAYFVKEAHGFNSVHGRMPSVATGAIAANRDLVYIGISGDGDSLSIGLGQFCHAIRRGIDMLYVLENNGVYGLTKGQFSASADIGTKSKRGEANTQSPIDPVLVAMQLGATYVARGFSGDKAQLVPLLKAGLSHQGFAFIDVISPCVTFNDHVGSTKSYRYTREHLHDLVPVDFVPLKSSIEKEQQDAGVTEIAMHDGSIVRFRKVGDDYDPTDRVKAMGRYEELTAAGEVVTGLLYVNTEGDDFHAQNHTTAAPLVDLPYEKLCPGSAALDRLMENYR
ncbi:MAG: 2-oxoacid:ferredoxin oxidoreductase subunit beta [Gemmatimonadota bacterium]